VFRDLYRSRPPNRHQPQHEKPGEGQPELHPSFSYVSTAIDLVDKDANHNSPQNKESPKGGASRTTTFLRTFRNVNLRPSEGSKRKIESVMVLALICRFNQ
jgi:hypothetical protein